MCTFPHWRTPNLTSTICFTTNGFGFSSLPFTELLMTRSAFWHRRLRACHPVFYVEFKILLDATVVKHNIEVAVWVSNCQAVLQNYVHSCGNIPAGFCVKTQGRSSDRTILWFLCVKEAICSWVILGDTLKTNAWSQWSITWSHVVKMKQRSFVYACWMGRTQDRWSQMGYLGSCGHI